MLPEEQLMDQFVVYELQEALAKDSSESAHPMTNPVKTPEELKGIFDYVTYGKCMYDIKRFSYESERSRPDPIKNDIKIFLTFK